MLHISLSSVSFLLGLSFFFFFLSEDMGTIFSLLYFNRNTSSMLCEITLHNPRVWLFRRPTINWHPGQAVYLPCALTRSRT